MFGATNYMITLVELTSWSKQVKDVFDEDEYDALMQFLAWHPEAGDVMPGTGGVRKLRWPAKSQGKRSGARVIYYFRDLNMPVYLLAVYTKGQKTDLTAAERRAMEAFVKEIVSAHAMDTYVRLVRRTGAE